MHRREFVNELYNKKKSLELALRRGEDAIHNLKHSTMDADFRARRVAKLMEKNEQVIKDIEKIVGQLEDDAWIDATVKAKVGANTEDHRLKRAEKMLEKKRRVEHKEQQQKDVKQYMNKLKQESRSKRWQQRDINFHHNLFLKACETLPGYMKRNLKNMPNNKGYIWRNVQFFGDKPKAPSDETVLFEKKSGTMFIHVYGRDNYVRVWKKGSNGKELLSEVYHPPKTAFSSYI